MKQLLFVLLLLPFSGRAQIVTTIAGTSGSGYYGNGGPATMAALNRPNEVCADNAGNIYIADYGNNAVRKINASGIISTFAGNHIPGYSGDGGQATAAHLHGPSDMVLDAAGNMYITDLTNNCVRKVATSGVISTIAGTGYPGFSGDGGLATAAELNEPFALEVDNSGNVFIADAGNNCIRKIDAASGMISTFAGDTAAGYSGDGAAATAARFNFPIDIASDNTGNFYIADNGNNAIRKIDAAGNISTFAGTGIFGFTGDGVPATSSALNGPYSVCTDHDNNVYITDNANYRIRKVDAAGIITTVAGNGTPGYTGDGGPATDATFDNTGGITFDTSGNMIIADFGNNVVRKIVFHPTADGIGDPENTAGTIDIYPNPAGSRLTVSATGKITAITINDCLGRRVCAYDCDKPSATVDIAALPAGVYFINVNGSVVRKFVKE